MPNHVEHNFKSVILDNAVPELVFTIDFGIQILPGSPLQNKITFKLSTHLYMKLVKMYKYLYHLKIIPTILLLFKMELPCLQILFHHQIHIINRYNSHIHPTLSRILYHQMLKTRTIIMKYKLNFQIQTVIYNSHQLLITQGMKF